MLLTLLASQASAENLRAYYEIKAEFASGNSSSARTSTTVVFGTPIIHEFGDYQLSLLFEPNQDEPGQYSLEISLKFVPRARNSISSTVVSRSFAGRISNQLDFSQSEFTIDEAGTNLSIVIRLSEVI